MRHRKFGKKLNRSPSHRKALRRNLVRSLFRHERIVTTLPKAKAARRDAERLITIGKVENLHNIRKAFAFLQDDELVNKLFKDIAVRYRDTRGGYTAVHRMAANRLGDNASQVVWQLVTWEPGTKPKPRKKKKAPRKAAPAPEAPTATGAADLTPAAGETPDGNGAPPAEPKTPDANADSAGAQEPGASTDEPPASGSK